MRVLVACEFSGIVREAFKARGHDAWSCDLLPTDIPGQHIQGDVLPHLGDGWDLMIAHPPCTYLCQASNGNIRKQGYHLLENRDIAASFFMALIEAPIPRIAVENPIGCMSSRYRKPDQIIRPYMFGHEYRKDTCLWLKGLPKLIPTKMMWPPYKKLDFWSDKRNPNGRSLKSITFSGIAAAMAEQWGG